MRRCVGVPPAAADRAAIAGWPGCTLAGWWGCCRWNWYCCGPAAAPSRPTAGYAEHARWAAQRAVGECDWCFPGAQSAATSPVQPHLPPPAPMPPSCAMKRHKLWSLPHTAPSGGASAGSLQTQSCRPAAHESTCAANTRQRALSGGMVPAGHGMALGRSGSRGLPYDFSQEAEAPGLHLVPQPVHRHNRVQHHDIKGGGVNRGAGIQREGLQAGQGQGSGSRARAMPCMCQPAANCLPAH